MLLYTYFKGTVVRGINTLHANTVVYSVRKGKPVRHSVPSDAYPERIRKFVKPFGLGPKNILNA